MNVDVDDLVVGDKIRFVPDSNERAWWTVIGRDDRHVVAVRQAPFSPKGDLQYTITGLMSATRNGAGPGLVRSSLNTLGGGWNLTNRESEGAAEILAELRSGRFELSMRRVVDIERIERKGGVRHE